MQSVRQSFLIHFLLLLFVLGLVVITGHAENAAGVPPSTSVGGDIDSLPSVSDSPQAAAPVAAPVPAQRGFFTRLGHAYLDDWTVDSSGAPTPPAPERRGTPRP